MKRSIISFSFFPTKLSDGTWIWLKPFVKDQIFKTVLQYESLGWPDEGYYYETEEWVTVAKKKK